MARILVADDDKVMLGLLSTLLDLEGDEAIPVTDPTQVTAIAQRERPDLILMDVHMAGGNTFPALESLRQDELLRHTPILMTSGMDLKEKCLRAGANEFILKPFRPAELLAILKFHLK